MMRAALLAFCGLSLTGCGAYEAREARHALIGLSVIDLQACAGVPSQVVGLDDHELLLDYSITSNEPQFSLKLLDDISMSLGPRGGCHFLARIDRGRVAAVHYSGTVGSLDGPNAACAPLVNECLFRADRTAIPAGYDPMLLARGAAAPKAKEGAAAPEAK
jgi:hypothetical protein